MFPEPALAPLGRADEPTGRRSTPRRKTTAPQWSKYRPRQRVACDVCLRDLVAAGGGLVARAARWRRAQGGADRLLCTAHMELARHADGLAPLDDNDGRLT